MKMNTGVRVEHHNIYEDDSSHHEENVEWQSTFVIDLDAFKQGSVDWLPLIV